MQKQLVFQRYELKFLLSEDQKERLMTYFPCYMRPDPYGLTTIRNLYYDSDHYRLNRRSIEKPVYKEKLRLRGYGNILPDSPVFVELKKKYKKIVYKRRLSMSEREATAWLAGISVPSDRSQIACEIEYVLHYYESLHPVVFLAYDRSAYFGKEDATFRITLDKNIVCRQSDLSLISAVYGACLLPKGQVLMEIKSMGAIPLWLVHFLAEEKLYQTSFSKYGTAYQQLILPKWQKEVLQYA